MVLGTEGTETVSTSYVQSKSLLSILLICEIRNMLIRLHGIIDTLMLHFVIIIVGIAQTMLASRAE